MKEFLLSVVIPVYNEGVHIKVNICEIEDILTKSRIRHEFVLIDDGSTDQTWNCIGEIVREISSARGVRFSRNFGKEAAICAGLDLVRGNACVVMDADLQHPPGLLPEMVRLWHEEGFEVVEAVKTSRGNEKLSNKIGAKWFYMLMKRFSGFDLDGASDYKLMDAKVIDAYRRLGEKSTFFRGISAWMGFKRTSISFEVPERLQGTTKWSMLKLFKLSISAITSFTSAPLHLVTILGGLFLLSSAVLGIQTLYKYFAGISISGFTTVILLLLIIGSTLMISLGIIGTYIAGIFNEVKGRPRYIITEHTDSDEVKSL